MGKKRVAKKRIVRRKAIKEKKNEKVKQEAVKKQDVPSVAKMSRLEYEQSMMDPRFRAAMMGFNNPIPGMNQMNNQLREQETKNNTLTRQINQQIEYENMKRRYIQLQSEEKEKKQQ